MKKKNQIQSNNKEVLKLNEFRQFIEWYALPDIFRNPKTQKEFAQKNNLNETTLVGWKKLDEFKKGVEGILKSWTWDKNRNVIASIYKSALKGNAASQRLWAEWQMNWIPKKGLVGEDGEEINVNIIYKQNGNQSLGRQNNNEGIQGKRNTMEDKTE